MVAAAKAAESQHSSHTPQPPEETTPIIPQHAQQFSAAPTMSAQGSLQQMQGTSSGGGQVMPDTECLKTDCIIVQRPYSLFNSFVDTIKSGKQDGDVTDVQYQSVDQQQYVSISYSENKCAVGLLWEAGAVSGSGACLQPASLVNLSPHFCTTAKSRRIGV